MAVPLAGLGDDMQVDLQDLAVFLHAAGEQRPRVGKRGRTAIAHKAKVEEQALDRGDVRRIGGMDAEIHDALSREAWHGRRSEVDDLEVRPALPDEGTDSLGDASGARIGIADGQGALRVRDDGRLGHGVECRTQDEGAAANADAG